MVFEPRIDDLDRELSEAPLPVCLTGSDYEILWANRWFEGVAKEAVGSSLVQVFRIAGPLRPSSEIQILNGSRLHEGEEIPVVLAAYPRASDPSKTLILVFDGEPFREAEAVRFDFVPYGVVRVTRGGSISFANSAAHQLLGNDARSRQLSEIFSPESAHRISVLLTNAYAGGRSQPISATIADGDRRKNLQVLISPDFGPGGVVVGALAIIRPEDMEAARSKVRKAALAPENWRKRLNDMLQVVNDLMPFDLVTFGIYAEDVKFFRPIFILPENAQLWPSRWMPLGPGIKEWLNSPITWSPDIQAFAADFPGLKEDPVFRAHLDFGIKSFVSLPVFGPSGPTSALSFASRKSALYDESSRDLLRQLGITRHLYLFEREFLAESENFVREMRSRIGLSDTLRHAAEFITPLREHFDWDYAALYRIERKRNRFRLLNQSASKKELELAIGRVQQLEGGLLGEVLRSQKETPTQECRVEIVDYLPSDGDEELLEISASLRSAMTCLIPLNGDWYWVLVIASLANNAFHGPEVAALKDTIQAIEGELGRLYSSELNRLLLKMAPEGVVVTNASGIIVEANRTASERLLGYFEPESPRGLPLVGFALEGDSQHVLNSEIGDTARRVTLRTTDGQLRRVLATRETLGEDFEASVWFLVDLEGREWNLEYRYLREVVNDVAQQTRGPLMLASSWLQKALHNTNVDVANSGIGRAIERTLAEIGKADITFERLSEELFVAKQPRREAVAFNLVKCISLVVQALPQRDQDNIELIFKDAECVIDGDISRIRFVIRSILSHLLRIRPVFEEQATKIRVELKDHESTAHLSMKVEGVELSRAYDNNPPCDGLLAGTKFARDESTLGLTSIEKIVEAHHGKIERQSLRDVLNDSMPVWGAFDVYLPREKPSNQSARIEG